MALIRTLEKVFFHEVALFRGNIVIQIFSDQLCVLQRPYNILIRLRSGILIVIIFACILVMQMQFPIMFF